MPTKRIAEPSREPVSLDEAKTDLAVDGDEHDLRILGMIAAARELAENELQRTLMTTGWEMRTDAFSRALRLDWPRVQSIQVVQFVAPDGQLLTLDPQDYVLDNADDSGPAWVVPARGRTWPCPAREVNAVRVRYLAGYGDDPTAVPASIRLWIRQHVRAFYDNPSAVTSGGVQALPYLRGLIKGYEVLG